MSRINLLSNETINAIAAGEVVERPSSVVKELVENSLDAGATAISIEIKGGGIDMIRVTDSGRGIDRDDITRAFERHATSKIESADDLIKVATLGFRGEALSSIAAVSQVELLTKTADEIVGMHYMIDGGRERLLEEAACPQGTTIIVSNLFYNTPARRKFLKSASAEGANIAELVERMAMSRPDVAFTFINGGKTILHSFGNDNLKELIYRIYGRDVSMHLLEVNKETELLRISGFIGKPILSRGNRSWENYFINSRYIKSDVITRAIEDAYKTFVMIHKFPFTAINIEIAPELIDVNVHPRKMELKFNQNEAVYNVVYETVRQVLENRELMPEASLDIDGKTGAKKSSNEDTDELKKETENKAADETANETENKAAGTGKVSIPEPFEKERIKALEKKEPEQMDMGTYIRQNDSREIIKEKAPDYDIESGAPSKTEHKTETSEYGIKKYVQESFAEKGLFDGKANYRLIGQVFGTYWMIEHGGKLYVMDQHAAHEKVLYEQFKKDFEEKTLAMQHIAPPVIISLSPSQEEIFKKYRDYFSDLCFEVEHFGGRDYAIYAVPLYLFEMNVKDIFVEILDSMSEESGSIEGSAITWRIATMACKAAVKGNASLSVQEADELIRKLSRCDNPYNCPHGRPTLISLTRYEFDKRFKRIQD